MLSSLVPPKSNIKSRPQAQHSNLSYLKCAMNYILSGNVSRNNNKECSFLLFFFLQLCVGGYSPRCIIPSQCKYLPAVPAAQCPAIVPKILGSRARVPHIEAITRNSRGICPALRNNIRQKLLQAGFVAFMNHMNGSICALVRG